MPTTTEKCQPLIELDGRDPYLQTNRYLGRRNVLDMLSSSMIYAGDREATEEDKEELM